MHRKANRDMKKLFSIVLKALIGSAIIFAVLISIGIINRLRFHKTEATPIKPTSLPTATISSNTTPQPIFHGRLLVSMNQDVVEIKKNPSTGDIKLSVITDGYAFVSPNKKYLLLSRSAPGTVLIELSTGKKTILDLNVSCVSWSPDDTKFNFIENESLYLYDLASTSLQVVDHSVSAQYLAGGVEGFPQTKYGALQCGTWIGLDRFVYEKYMGSMPMILKGEQGQGQLSANSTILATIGPNITLTSIPKRWEMIDYCPQKSLVLFQDTNHNILLARSFKDLASIKPIPIKLNDYDGYSSIGFTPNDCELYYIGHSSIRLKLIDPETLQENSEHVIGKSPSSHHVLGTLLGFEKVVWMGNPKDWVVIGKEYNSEKSSTSIAIFDIRNDAKTQLVEFEGQTMSLIVLAWLPE